MTPRVWRWMACAALAAAVLGSGSPPDAIADSVASDGTYYIGGRGKLAVKRVFAVRPNVTWRIELEGDSFELNGLGETALTGTLESLGKSGRKLSLTFDEQSLVDLAGALQAEAEAHGVEEPPTLAITKSKALIVLGKKPEKTKLKMKLSMDVVPGEENPVKAAQAGLFKVNCRNVSRRVVVLDDLRSAPQVMEALRRKRISAFNVGYYENWDGIHPPLEDTDVVLFLQGYEYDDTLTPEADQALVDFVNGGGLLVRTEWCAYEYGDGDFPTALAIDALLPVRAPESDYEDPGLCSWTITDRKHPLTKGLKAAFDIDGAGFSFINPIEGATVLATNQRDEPNLTIAGFGAGEVVHVNNDLTYNLARIPKSILRILTNCVTYGLKR